MLALAPACLAKQSAAMISEERFSIEPEPHASPGSAAEALQQSAETLAARLDDPAAVYLFGSHARGNARPDSDVDLAVFSDGRPLSPVVLLEVSLDLAAALGAPVDVVHLDAASTILQREAIDGVRLYAADPLRADLFELAVLREYEGLMRRRAGIDAEIATSGRVLGRA